MLACAGDCYGCCGLSAPVCADLLTLLLLAHFLACPIIATYGTDDGASCFAI